MAKKTAVDLLGSEQELILRNQKTFLRKSGSTNMQRPSDLIDFGKNKGLLVEIPMDKILIKSNVRKDIHEKALDELKININNVGLINPITVVNDGDNYVIITGRRRFLACQLLSWEKIPAILKRDVSVEKALEEEITENLTREDLTPFEETDSYRSLMEIKKMTPETLSEHLGKSKKRIYRSLSYSKLETKVARARLEKLPKRVLDELVPIMDEPYFDKAFKKIQEGNYGDIREFIKKFKEKKAKKHKKDMYNDQEKIIRFVEDIDNMLLKFKVRYHNHLTEVDEDSLKIEIVQRLKAVVDTIASKFSGSRKIEIIFDVKDSSLPCYEKQANLDLDIEDSKNPRTEIFFPSTSKPVLVLDYLLKLNYELIDYSTEKQDVIKTIKNIINIQEDVLEETDRFDLIDKWNYIAFYDKRIEKLNNFYFKLLKNKSFKLPPKQDELKKIALKNINP
jgi:ParB family chromosome partitioning protein